MKTYFVYILKCSDGSYYTGLTNNIESRINQHNSGLNTESYTFKRRPLNLVFSQDFSDVNQAIHFEKKIKKWSAKKKTALINEDHNLLQILAECRNVTHLSINQSSVSTALDMTLLLHNLYLCHIERSRDAFTS